MMLRSTLVGREEVGNIRSRKRKKTKNRRRGATSKGSLLLMLKQQALRPFAPFVLPVERSAEWELLRAGAA